MPENAGNDEKNWSKYGFILRYPNEKSQLTGIIYEPWHYRYVVDRMTVRQRGQSKGIVVWQPVPWINKNQIPVAGSISNMRGFVICRCIDQQIFRHVIRHLWKCWPTAAAPDCLL